jgi:hypothetical protein
MPVTSCDSEPTRHATSCGLVAWSAIPEEVLGLDESDFADGRKLHVAIAVFFKVPLPSVEFVSNLRRI